MNEEAKQVSTVEAPKLAHAQTDKPKSFIRRMMSEAYEILDHIADDVNTVVSKGENKYKNIREAE